MKLNGKTIIILGGTSGIGLATAQAAASGRRKYCGGVESAEGSG